MRPGTGKISVLLLVVAALAAFFLLGLGDALTLEALKQRQNGLAGFVAAHPWRSAGGFLLLYVAVTALSLPGATILTLASGAIFGLWWGIAIASVASTIGASIAFLTARYLLRGWVKARFARTIAAVDSGIERDGAFYLLSLRLIPLFPFFLINLASGLTAMRLLTFALVSQVGMLPATALYVNAGTQLVRIERTSDILSPGLIGSMVLLGLFPLLARWLVGRLRRRRLYKAYRRPARFDRNLIVIGAGAGGLVTAFIAATVRSKVTLIEAREMGGDCLNTGCVPSKALIRTARLAHEMRNAANYGLEAAEPRFRLEDVMKRVRAIIDHIAPADSIERYTGLGVDVRIGHGRIVDPWTVEIDGRERITARSIVIAAGAEPIVPPIPGLAEAGYLTSETLWDHLAARDALPARIAIIGAGPVGTELAQAFARLGSKVTQIEASDRILDKEDRDVSGQIAARLRLEGVSILTGHDAVACEGKTLIAQGPDGRVAIPFDAILVAVGRKPRLAGYGLEALGIATDRTILANDYLETIYPNIFAAGDVAGPHQFTHFAAHQAWYAAVNALFGSVRRFRADYSALPWVTFTDPEIARIGHNEQSAAAAGIAFETVRYPLGHLDRAVTDGEAQGFVKLLVQPGKDRILGATIVASRAGEMIAEYALAVKHRLGLGKILGTAHAYPTMAEANKYAAGEWKKANKPERLLALAERYHRWRRR